jgi:cellulose synthase/poly-beta-1,6-N-acetylglucosamine synthase-like glycosyltransferase
MTTIAYILLFLYCVTLLYITIYCLAQFQLLYYYKKNKLEETKSVMPGKEEEFPFVTIQLPIFNELYVVERLIDNIVQIEYPSDRLEIQVLDDSTDETMELCRKKVEEQRAKGVNIEWIHRVDREGFKAGALRDGMARARGEFIAIFDADFLPRPDFLLRTIPYFEDEDVGVVQTRWEHINRDYSMLTRLQAMQLNVHFTVEQQGRAAGNVFLQFNGTAGVWRRETIEDAGGWEADTLTEDLDLSYRAQLKGWRIVYLEKVGSPAELPAEMNGLKSQQFRWMKGGAENARRLLPKVWKSELPLRQKLHSTFHLMASSVFLFVFMAGFLSVPMVFALQEIQFDSTFFTFSLAGLVSIIVIYYVGNVEAELHKEGSNLKNIFKFLILFPPISCALHGAFPAQFHCCTARLYRKKIGLHSYAQVQHTVLERQFSKNAVPEPENTFYHHSGRTAYPVLPGRRDCLPLFRHTRLPHLPHPTRNRLRNDCVLFGKA